MNEQFNTEAENEMEESLNYGEKILAMLLAARAVAENDAAMLVACTALIGTMIAEAPPSIRNFVASCVRERLDKIFDGDASNDP